MTAAAADPGARAAARLAADLIENGARVGLGTGRAASAFIARLGERARAGVLVTCVATSRDSARQAHAVGLPLIELTEDVELDVTVDGADEVAPNLDLLPSHAVILDQARELAARDHLSTDEIEPDRLPVPLQRRDGVSTR